MVKKKSGVIKYTVWTQGFKTCKRTSKIERIIGVDFSSRTKRHDMVWQKQETDSYQKI